jgi:hypothetical protein
MRRISEKTKVVEKIKTYILCSITYFRESCLYEITWKNVVEPDRQTDGDIIRRRKDEIFMPDNQDKNTHTHTHTHTHTEYVNTYCSSKAKMVIRIFF